MFSGVKFQDTAPEMHVTAACCKCTACMGAVVVVVVVVSVALNANSVM